MNRGLSLSTVCRHYSSLKSEKETDIRYQRNGRRSIMNKDAPDFILQYLKTDDSLTLEELTQKLRDEGINLSRETVRRKLKQIGYASKVPVEDYELSLQ